MEVYTLDSLLRRQELFDDHESLIWTERYDKYGDFELHIASTRRTRSLLTAKTLLACDVSYYVMRIESVEDGRDSEGVNMLTIKGRSLETIMYDRVAKESLDDLTTSPNWTITGLTPTNVARKVFHDICVTGILTPYDVIPFINEGTFTSVSNIPEPVDPVTVDIAPTSVYETVETLATTYGFGFRLLRQGDMSALWFDIYMGSDRTTGQTILPAVVFSPSLENLTDTKELVNVVDSKNVAYVYSPAGTAVVYAEEVETDVSGFDRRALVVSASDITEEAYPDPADVTAMLIQKGKEELAKAQAVQAFDGEINQYSQYKPNQHYFLGDLIEMRNVDGVANNMRVTEIIYAEDAEGFRAYPTLSISQAINSGSWLSWENNKMWAELGPEVWEELP